MPRSFDATLLQQDAHALRKIILTMLQAAGSGHAAGPLGLAEVYAVLYGSVLHHDPKNPRWELRDRVVVSNGHTCPVLYAALAHSGYFPVEDVYRYRAFGSLLEGHPHANLDLGIEISSGPLGQGFSQAVGMALAAKFKQQKHHVFAMTSDGEHQEGQVWEAYMSGAKYALDNLTVVIDRNYIQISGVTEAVMPLDPFSEKIAAFGWSVQEVNGHDVSALHDAFQKAKADGEPSAIIVYTEPGKGVSFMEHSFSWHGYQADQADMKQALRDIASLQGKIRRPHE